jgi:SAM-dependent methyltransferase
MNTPSNASIYDDGTYRARNAAWHTEDSDWKASKIAAILDRHNVKASPICDVGCGAGKIIEALARHYPEAECHGFDTSVDAAAFWPKDASSLVSFRNTDILAGDQRFGLILNIDVFEHVEDYLGFLRKLSKRADYFVFHIPLELHVSAILRANHGKARYSVGHLHHFSQETALLTLADTGYDVIAVELTRLSQETVEGRRPITNALNILRKMTGIVSERLSARLFGGYSLLVLARVKEVQQIPSQGQS